MLWLSYGYVASATSNSTATITAGFHLLTWLSYSCIYLLPLLLAIKLLNRVSSNTTYLHAIVVLVFSVMLLILVRIDLMIYTMYKFHINRFVLNLIFTPGGISSLGSEGASYLSMFLLMGTMIATQCALLFFSRVIPTPAVFPFKIQRLLPYMFGGMFILQGLIYGVSDINHYSPILEGSRAYPLFQRIRFRSLAKNLGYERAPDARLSLTQPDSSLVYPLKKVEFATVSNPPNIIILVAESLRWDQLDSKIMPNTWRFGKEHLQFNQHYSSGNGTREGLFGMFYGLYGSYWEQFMHMRQSPLLMDRMQALGYQFDLRTGATFTYPEFDKTLFANFPAESLIEADADLPAWQRDKNNMDALLAFIEQREPSRPFMSFMFLESSHASYSFPEHAALYQNYQKHVDYTKMGAADLAENIEPLFNRYHNSAHWIDIQLGRLYQSLEADGLLESTIVIVTGDHGEEFMEKGAWGHNTDFVEEQTHVPMVMHIPGQAAQSFSVTSSHLDVATTLLQKLGAPQNTGNYSLGMNLFNLQEREYIVISDWHSIGVQTADLKYRIPYLNAGADYWEPTDENDEALTEKLAKKLVAQYQSNLLEAMKYCTAYTSQH